MVGTIRHKLSKSISKLKIPTIYSLHKCLIIPRTYKRTFEFADIKVSENSLFKVSDSLITFTILFFESNGNLSLLTENLNKKTTIEELSICKTFQIFKELTSKVSVNLLLSQPQIEILNSLKIDLPKTFILNFNTSNPPIQILNFSSYIPIITKIDSENIFKKIKKVKIYGKNYRKPEPVQKSLFDDYSTKDEFILPEKIRKAYKSNNNLSIPKIIKQDFWDLLFPILQPPLNLDFSGEFDLYQPLFNYQKAGIEFLFKNKSALLADEMGTGKTVQAIVALRILFRQNKIKHVLVLCPFAMIGSAYLSQITSKPEGWDGHFYKWAPELTVTVVRGSQEQRKKDWSCPAHVYISTYDILRIDINNGNLNEKDAEKFDCVILDEAQNIKNPNTDRYRAVLKLKPSYRWALTGTPIENRIEDLISIFTFVHPNLFSNKNYNPIEVTNKIKPHFLRRLKKDVLADLPEKIRQEQWLDLDDDQRQEYEEALKEGQKSLLKMIKDENKSDHIIRRSIFNIIVKLKQICNFAKEKFESPKTEALLELIQIISENKKKVLIFSQFIDEGISKLKTFLENNKIQYVSITGNDNHLERERAVQAFRESPEITVFLSTVRTGGVGITLTEASYVIHFDHWWNPATMLQAEDRAHRLGQADKLTVYSFWMRDTIEENIKQKLHEKGLLIDTIINSLAKESIDEILSTSEWLEILGIKEVPMEDKTTISNKKILEYFTKVSPKEFEVIVQEFFKKQGFENARLTKPSHDDGVDIYGSRRINDYEESFIAQCKHTDSVGVKVVREFYGVLADKPKDTKGFLITSGKFTRECKDFAEKIPRLELIDGATFANLLRQLNIIKIE